jgi:SAM-dependent methyltransferase
MSDSFNPFRDIWQERVSRYGKRAADDLAIDRTYFSHSTNRQLNLLISLFKAQIVDKRKARILDFGCGYGRFSNALANIYATYRVLAYDPCSDFFNLASYHKRVRYRACGPHSFFHAEKHLFDAMWIVNVLGYLPDDIVSQYGPLLNQLLAPDGLLFLVERTAEKEEESDSFWKARTVPFYTALFPEINLTPVGAYVVQEKQMTVLAGRKIVPSS